MNSQTSSWTWRATACPTAILALCAGLLAGPALAQSAAGGASAPPSPAASPTETSVDLYSASELEEIVGPIALYPDGLIASILPASTVPLDVVQAARWLQQQTGEVSEVPDGIGWDDSVVALIQYPDVLQWLDSNLDWLGELGFAVTNQLDDVMAAIQTFRQKAQTAGNLGSNDKQTVETQDVDGNSVIVVQPADPTVVYVPSYDPVTVVQPVYTSGGVALINWGLGVAVGAAGAWAFHSLYWGAHGHCGIYHHRSSYHWSSSHSWNGSWNGPNRPGNWNPGNRPGYRPPQRPPHRPGGGVNRPSHPIHRPGGGNRPGGGVRPPAGGNRPGAGRPGTGAPGTGRPGTGAPGIGRPGTGAPGAGRPTQLPSGGMFGGGRPSADRGHGSLGGPSGGLSRPSAGQRPSVGQRPSMGSRPSSGSRPSLGSRPSSGARPSLGNRPSSGSRPTPRARPAPSRSSGSFGGVRSGGGSARGASSRGGRSMGGGGRGGGGRR